MIDAIARHYSARAEGRDDPLNATITLGGRRIAIATATVAGEAFIGENRARARFRDDRVARRFLSDLEAAVEARAPDGRMVILTLGAPIRLPNQTLAALSERLLQGLASGAADEKTLDVLGNRVRFQVLSDGSRWTSKAVGFVVSGDLGPGELANAIRAVDDAITAKAATGTPDGFAGDRWLVLAGDDWIADVKTFRRGLSRRSIPHRFAKILVFDRGRIEMLVD